ncbi:MAG TPA: cytochrome c-type biogenesis CcmF C-terminal domain-containing protein, partial [Ktedonobacteraceae bacterium]|nr:cytochrome c-type biogenesis CcmF C-terminal domain-containing protein [Ktedonobacteraceae bacterium]
YQRVNGPILLVLIVAMGIGPLLAWRRTSLSALWRHLGIPALAAALCAAILPIAGVRDIWANMAFAVCAFTAGAILYEIWRGVRVQHSHGENYLVALFTLIDRYRQRYGGYIVHLGFILLAIGVIGSNFFQSSQDAVLTPGQEINVAGFKLVYFGNVDLKYPDVETITSQLQVWRDGQLQGYIYPGRSFYPHFDNQPASSISITTYNLTDLYVFLADWNGAGQATIRVFVNPLVPLVWLGGLTMLYGGIVCWWPTRPKRRAKTITQPASVGAGVAAEGGGDARVALVGGHDSHVSEADARVALVGGHDPRLSDADEIATTAQQRTGEEATL